MKKLLFIPILFIVSSVYGWDVVSKNGIAECIECESYEIYNSTTQQTEWVVIADTRPATIVNEMKDEGFRGSRTKWVNEINKRLNETYKEKRARAYLKEVPITDQLDALWKIQNNQEDEQSNAVKAKIAEIKTKYPKQ